MAAFASDKEHIDDMINLPELSENSVLNNLKVRYRKEIIYTYTGSILVAANPYKWISIYDDAMVKQYSQARIGDLPPHIFAIAEASFYNMRTLNENQSVIISGESGAGKTESTKLILQYLTAVTTNQDWVEQQIMEANTILEAFGNAKTVRNNNSSRFGKFMQVHFSAKRHIIGASIINYLLEKSRVVAPATDERTYHCFYQLTIGATKEEKEKYKLLAPKDYIYLSQSGCMTVDTIPDAKEFEALKLAMTVLNLGPDEMDGIFRILSAILHFGNVAFKADDSGESAHLTNPAQVGVIASILQVDEKLLQEALLKRSIQVRTEISMIPLKGDQPKDNRDAICKALYSRLFDWLVGYINKSILPKEKSMSFIGVLDIFGFELFKVNSFEQLCINYANEKLQQFFTNFIFKLEQAEYDKEGINWAKVEFSDNADCIEMLEGKLGIIDMLDEESRFPKATDQTYLEKLVAAHGKHKNFSKSKQAGSTFGVIHYAGDVQYLITGFLDKNKDEVSELAFETLKKTKVDLLRVLADQKGATDDDGRTAKKKSTVASNFRAQLLTLVSVLGSTAPQYVRCIKPNSAKSAFLWDDELVLAQLRYSGMLETIRIRKAGYAWRVPFTTFYKKYRWLASKLGPNAEPRDQCKQILDQLKMSSDHWQLGKTKVFMRNSVFIPLQDALDRHIKRCATIVAKVIKGNYYRQHYKRIRANVQILQKAIRMYAKRSIFLRRRKAAIRIQAVIRGWFARDYYAQLKREKAEREERLRKEAEAKAKREAEEAERRRIEEEARRSREAAEAERKRQADEKKRVEEEKKKSEEDAKKEAARLKKEEEEILKLTKAAMNAKEGGSESLGQMFDFLNIVDKDLVGDQKQGGNELDGLDDELEEIFENGAKVLRKRKSQGVIGGAPAAPAPPSDVDIYEKLKKRGEGKTDASRAMKSNPLSRKDGDKEEHSENETMAAFAAKYFEEHDKLMGGTIANTISRKKKKVTMEEMLCFTRQPIPLSMLKVTVPADDARHDKMVTVAIEIFREGLRIGDATLKNTDPSIPPMIQNVVKLGIGVPELRDEILVQLVRQCTENPADMKNWDIISIRYWQLLAVCLSCFPPSKTLAKPLRNFLRVNSEFDEEAEEKRAVPDPEWDAKRRIAHKKEIAKLAQFCEEAFKQSVLNGARKTAPSVMEIDALKSGRPIICRFYFLDGNVKAIGINSYTTAQQAIKDLAKRIDLPDPAGWSIYEVFPDHERVLKMTENIADILSRWETESTALLNETKYQTVRKNVAPVQAVGGGDAKLFLKRRLFRTPQKIPTDPVEYHLIYSQAVHSVLHGDFPLNDQAALRLAGLKAQVDWGDFDQSQTGRLNNLANFLPAKFIPEKAKDEWVKEIASIHSKLVGKSSLQAKVLYLEAVKQFPMYGATFFPAVYKGFWQHSNNVMIAVHVDGIAWLHQKTKAILKMYSYERLINWELDDKMVAFNLKAEPGEPDTETHRVEFTCDEAEEVVNLIKEYSPAHRTGITKDDKAKKAAAAPLASSGSKTDLPAPSDTDMGQMAVNLENARQRLLGSGLLRSPGPEALNAGNKFGTLKKLTVKKMPMPETSKGPAQYTVADWCFSKTKLSFSLSNFDMNIDAELNEQALKIQSSIMAYAGYAAAPPVAEGDDNRVPFASMIQDLMRGIIDSDKARDELYLQLIKLTTNHPEPDSKPVIKIWKLLCVACWIALPTNLVLQLLQAHLHLCGYGSAAMFASRVREAEHAKYALHAVQRVMHAGNRRQPPSAEELAQVTNLKDMFTRFYYMDNQSRALTFDPATTSAEIIEVIKEKINAKACQGFALFESFGALERAMTGREKIADTIYKWQKFARQTNADKSLRLTFKRRVFMPPHNVFTNDVERDLVVTQLLNDIANDKYPVTDDEAVLLTALRTQIETGDSPTYNGTESVYATNVKKFFPKHLIKQGIEKTVAAQHSKLRGKSKDECTKQIVDTLVAWEFYGHTIFNVLQSYTSAMPNNLWLVVGHSGVHVLNRRSKTALLSFPYKSIVNYSPSHKNIMIMTESLTRGTKYVFNTSEASQIAHLIKEYTDAIVAARKREGKPVKEKAKPAAAPAGGKGSPAPAAGAKK